MNQAPHNQFDQQPQAAPSRVVQIPLHFTVRIGTTADAYGMRVKLPGIRDDYRQVRVDVGPLGLVHVEGVVTNPEILQELARQNNVNVHETVTSGHFCLSVRLPGRIVSEPMMLDFKPNGDLEAMFRKDIYGDPWAHWPVPENNAQV